MIKGWLEDFDDWHPGAWEPEIIAHRLIAWLTHAPLAFSTRDLVYHSAVMNSMARQARHLDQSELKLLATKPDRVGGKIGNPIGKARK